MNAMIMESGVTCEDGICNVRMLGKYGFTRDIIFDRETSESRLQFCNY